MLLHKLGLVKCQFCDTFFSLSDKNNHYSNVTRANIKKAIKDEKGLIFWKSELDDRKTKFKSAKRKKDYSYERRYLCWECTSLLFSDKNK